MRYDIPVRPHCRHRIIGVGYSDNSGEEGDIIFFEPVGISRTVHKLVVMTYYRGQVAEQSHRFYNFRPVS